MAVRVPFPFVRGLGNAIATHELYRDLEFLGNAIGDSGLPFVVVASDGTGDYTDISDAIAAAPAVGTNVGAHFIWVKPSTTAYDDTAAIIDVGGKNIVIFGPGTNPFFDLNQEWSSLGFTATGSAGAISVYGMNIDLLGTNTRLINATAASLTAYFTDCLIEGSGTASLLISAATGTTFFEACSFTIPVWRSAVTFTGALYFNNCRGGSSINFSPSGSAVTVTGQPSAVVCQNSDVTWGDTFTVTSASAPTTGVWTFKDCSLQSGTGVSQAYTNQRVLIFTGCVGSADSTSLRTITSTASAATATNRCRTAFSGNLMSAWGIVVTDTTGAADQDRMMVEIQGIYRSISIGVSYSNVDVVLDVATYVGALTMITLTNACESCNIKATLRGTGATAKALDIVSGGVHEISLSGTASCVTASTPALPAVPAISQVFPGAGTNVLTATG